METKKIRQDFGKRQGYHYCVCDLLRTQGEGLEELGCCLWKPFAPQGSSSQQVFAPLLEAKNPKVTKWTGPRDAYMSGKGQDQVTNDAKSSASLVLRLCRGRAGCPAQRAAANTTV